MTAYWHPLVGGILIGAAAASLLLTTGKVAGVSGILAGVLSGVSGWRSAFILGLFVGPTLVRATSGRWPPLTLDAGLPVLVLAGSLVGLGTRLGGGCTSGHGVCGLARLSPRSVAAVATFMVTAAATVFVVRHGGVR